VPSLEGRDPDEVLAEVPQDAFRSRRHTAGVTEHGIIFDDIRIIDPVAQVRMRLRNTWLRYVGVYAEFFNAANQRIHLHNDPIIGTKRRRSSSLDGFNKESRPGRSRAPSTSSPPTAIFSASRSPMVTSPRPSSRSSFRPMPSARASFSGRSV
jgi:hypothetical protein